jgi:hypothetical protein
MQHGFGPYGIVSPGEVFATLAVLCLALAAVTWMAYLTRRRVQEGAIGLPTAERVRSVPKGLHADEKSAPGGTLEAGVRASG